MDQRIFYQLCKFNSSSSISRRAHVSLGLKCSYKCSFCYYNKHRNSDFYSEDSIIQYLDFLYKYGIKDIEFTGGEPLEYDRKSFLKIIDRGSANRNLTWFLICDDTGIIANFMGKPALYRQGKSILTQFMYPEYSREIRDYAGKTLAKMMELDF